MCSGNGAFFGENAFDVISNIVVKITLPAAIAASSSGKAIHVSMLAITVLGFTGGLLYILAAVFLHRNMGKEKQSFAMPFTQSFLGSMGVITVLLLVVML